jgi:hypothetical protein
VAVAVAVAVAAEVDPTVLSSSETG